MKINIKLNQIFFNFIIQYWCVYKKIDYQLFYKSLFNFQWSQKNKKEFIDYVESLQKTANFEHMDKDCSSFFNVSNIFNDYFHPKMISESSLQNIFFSEIKKQDNNAYPCLIHCDQINNKNHIIIKSLEDYKNLSFDKNIQKAIKIGFPYEETWLDSIPPYIVDCLQTKYKNCSIWCHLCPKDNIDDQINYRFSQLGMSLFFHSPKNKKEFVELFNNNKKYFKYWVSNSHSTQWVYPFFDIVFNKMSHYFCFQQNKNHYWRNAQKFNKDWMSFESLIFKEFIKTIGGEGIFLSMSCLTVVYLEYFYKHFYFD